MPNEEAESPVPEDRLAPQMPDPAGPPQPVLDGDPVLRNIAHAGVILVAVGGLLLPLFASTGSTMGATRSVKLQWEQRQRQIDQAIQAEQPAAPQETRARSSRGDADGCNGI